MTPHELTPTSAEPKMPVKKTANSGVETETKKVSVKATKAQPTKSAKSKFLARDPEATPETLLALLNKDDATNRLLAKHPKANVELLEKLSHSSDKVTRKSVCLNPNSPKDILLRLAPQFPSSFFKNPAFDWLILEDPDLLFNLGQGVLKTFLKRRIVQSHL
jgi:hypothetical protein